ncbi:alpha-N-acetylglucosaminidase [Bacteroides helcogenes]|uniref:Alpha-N-acetylglucosaminidase n=1 Tax=Bacteroides helcogenes (strain ATCC 35417 / DSM 20613 / JCM 6297 / CCUG 15421 / P 36-108) TaxID=693979 RepID=E6SUW5_BACT6|nr:alpha-N-acetylglucosaminidase [Bacteroides helcogenes]ADV42401.1 Alpha-N-acetylglucosaminidase [Bacteroides helcogenes P 36-108]MDY5237143.1 alpha-N-acetylglucosaminidase [Bacteroides helcogenes]
MKKQILFLLLLTSIHIHATSPIQGLLERIDKGASRKFVIEQVKSDKDFFELDRQKGKVVVRGNNYVSIATGINWYLKYHAGIHLCWNNMQAKLPDSLPPVPEKERHDTDLKYRYNLNYCTYSYTMAFWDWERWEKEIDWMALHGINLPLSIVGTGSVWRNVLSRLGYSKEEVNEFVAGPAFQAWWLMNNLEGWGGPNPDQWYSHQEQLQKRILKRMREYGIEPVLPGYSGMIPANAKEKLGLDVADPGKWCGYRRPAFLQPSDKNFRRIARLYYKEMTRLYGKANYYSMDPFHEGGNTKGVDLDAAGKSIRDAMKEANPQAVWVAQAWGACPYDNMIKNLPEGDMIVLDLYSESRPQWGDPASAWYRKQGFGRHGWIYCMLLNFGGNVGLYGKMEHVIDEFYKARESAFGGTLQGVGLTMEGSENNPVMYELLCELPWHGRRISKDQWLKSYLKARYGKTTPQTVEAWLKLSNTIYNSPNASTQQGTHESVFCARPSLEAYQVSSWSEMKDYYAPADIIRAAGKMIEAAEEFRGNNNFEYDLIDVVRQAVAEKGRLVYPIVVSAYKAADKQLFEAASARFLELIELQDKLLGTRREFRLGTWTNYARNMGETDAQKDLYEWNARVQITTWGNRTAANEGGLHDYAHKEWNGLLRDFYYMRWKAYFDELRSTLNGNAPKETDFYTLEENWAGQHNPYSAEPEGDATDIAKEVYGKITDK